MKTQKDRLLEFIKFLGISVRAFERSIGTSQAAIPQVKEKLSPALLNKVCAGYPQLNKFWLLTGEGSMLNPEAQAEVQYFNTGTAIQGGDNNIINADQSAVIASLNARIKELEETCESLRESVHERDLQIARMEGMIEVLKS